MDGGMTISGDVSNIGVTTFVNEACEAVDIFSTYKPSTLVVSQPDLQDLKAYFERPRLIKSGVVPFGTRTRLEYVEIRNALDMATLFPQWTGRLAGAYGIRFKLNFRLQVTATAFHQGLLALAWQYGYRSNNDYIFDRGLETASVTNLPHVRLDLSENTMVEFSIPFLYVSEFMPVEGAASISEDFTYGALSFNILLPVISVVNLSTARYQLYTYLTDIEVFGADNYASSTIALQSGGVISKELKNSHLLSNTLTGAAKVSSFVSRHIPSLSAIAGTAAWALDTASGVARYFGYSRPMLQDPFLRVVPGQTVGETNVDVPMAGVTCGPMQSNTLSVNPEFGATDVDEMALAFVTSQWSPVNIGRVTASDTHGSAIYAAPVSPAVMWFRAPVSAPYCNRTYPLSSTNLVSQSGNAFQPTSLMYISSFFRLWRGSMVFRFTFAKNKFHGGRYLVSYNPKIFKQVTPGNYGNAIDGPEVAGSLVQPYGYSMIIDLKDGNIFEFTVPYVVEVPYLTFNSSSGGISMVCLDPVSAAGSVTPDVPFLVEVKGGDDYELSDYAGNLFMPSAHSFIYQQSGGIVTSATKSPAEYTIGERLTSIKQMIQIPAWTVINLTANTNYQNAIPPWFTWCPATMLANNNTLPPPVDMTIQGSGSSGGALSKCYAFAKGGTDLHLYATGTQVDALLLHIEQNPQELSTSTGQATSYVRRSNKSGVPKVISSAKYPLHVRCPAYQQYVRVATTAADALGFNTFTPSVSGTLYDTRAHFDFFRVINNSAAASKLFVARAAADDAALSHYMGPIPIYIPNGSSTVPMDRDWNF